MARTLDQVPASEHQRVLIYGAPKSGKTELAGRLAEEFNILFFSLENGHSVLKKLPIEWQKRITLIQIPDTRTFPVAIETMLKVIKGGEVSICDEHGLANCIKCKTAKAEMTPIDLHNLPPNTIVIVDSLTQLTNSAISHITKGKPDDYKLDFDDWGNLGKLMDIFLSNIQQAPFSVVCISHETEAEYEDGKKKIVPVAGTRNFSRNTAKYFDHVIYAEVKNLKHRFGSATTYSNSIVSGSRTDVVIDESNPSLLPIMRGEVPSPKGTATTNSQGVNALANLKAGLVNKEAL